MEERKYDIVVYGATGFTGQLVAEYLAKKGSLPVTKWAIAGRNKEKLESVRQALCRIDPACCEVDIIRAESSDRPGLKVMAGQTRIVVSTVGPYALYGEPLVQACVMMGTHYLDITGEPQFVRTCVEKYSALAEQKQALVINCCGFDSIPADLGAYFTVSQLKDKSAVTVKAFVSSKGQISGGTWASALNAMSEGFGSSDGDGSGSGKGRLNGSIHYDDQMKKWAVPMPVVDRWMVRRSAAAHPELYGTDFVYGQYIGLKNLPMVAGLLAGVGAVYVGSQVGFIRELMKKFRPSGAGPDAESREKHFFRLTFFGSSNGETVKTTVSGGDPGYTETSKMLAESALTVLDHYGSLPVKGGVHTPAGALGAILLDRLQKAGIRFEVK